ncbi:ARM repeat-containing protein [Nemania sp. FL0031]|nr:ARM repeat-containing protein [Nemania sp. FL0031]
MTAITWPHRNPILNMSDPNNKNAQNLGPFTSSTWQSNAIWGRPGIGGSRNSNQDASFRDADELSPTAPSGSAQLNGFSESGPWPRAVWGPTNTSPNDPSPPHTKNSFSYHFSENSNLRTTGQTSGLGNIMRPPGSGGSPTSLRYNAAVGAPSNEERGGSGMYGAPGTSQLGSDAPGSNRRNSTDPNFSGVGRDRIGGFPSRRPETNGTTMTSQYGESRQYSFSQGSHTQPQHQRPSVSNVSVSMAPETTRGQPLPYSSDSVQTSLSESLNRNLKLEDTAESLNGYVSNGYGNSPSQPFQLNPGSQSWQQDMNHGTRGFGYPTQQDGWIEPPAAPYSGAKRGSIERSSPATNSYRTHLNSPRNLSGTPNSRMDLLPRPTPRNPNMSPDVDRQQPGFQYPLQTSGFFPPPHFASHPQYYEHYTQVPNYRGQIQNGYGGQVNYVGVRTNRDKDSSQGARSLLLEEFRSLNKSNRRYELKDLRGHIVEFSGDQHGSRFIQDKLTAANSEEKEHVFREIESNAVQLMKDVFGNYVIQKFFEHGNQVQKKLLAAQMKGKVCELSVQMYSCRVVQKALEHVLVEQQKEIVEELRSSVVQVAKDPNGNHVVQKVILMFPGLCIPFIMEAFQGQIERLSTDGYACRVIQRILEKGTDDEKKKLMADIHPCSAKLMTDQYGNYVIQHIISHGKLEDRSIMIHQAIDRALLLSRHKYASNVVEKCIQYGTADERSAIRTKFTAGGDGHNQLQAIVKDQFGNYVIQKLLDFLEGEEKAIFAREVKAVVPQLRRQGNGRQNTALERLVGACEAVASVSAPTNGTNGSTTTTGTAPSTPNLAVEVSSNVPTPLLTTEQNSPQSSSPPSTSISTADEATEEAKAAEVSSSSSAPSTLVVVQEN